MRMGSYFGSPCVTTALVALVVSMRDSLFRLSELAIDAANPRIDAIQAPFCALHAHPQPGANSPNTRDESLQALGDPALPSFEPCAYCLVGSLA
uniref:DUF2946 domain-containing protein n=1 Tax=Mesocestoides corti TaxID=53468 RepID=A0A5K3EVQ4_MESCO